MAANEYIQAAAAQLQNAATAVKAEADQLRADLSHIETNMKNHLDVKDQEMRLRNVELTQADSPQQAGALTMVVRTIRKDMDNRKHELDRTKVAIQEQIKQKENAVQSLKMQAQSLQNLAASFK